jgi:catechol 2,3-dioxygenase-like lactoylglutathione lyase family enzyme
MRPFTGGLHHLSIRTTDLARAKRFYTETMGFQPVRETGGAVSLNANGTVLGLLGAAPEARPADRFDPFRVGRLDHLALAVDNAESLHELKQQLDAAGVRNNSVEDDTVTGARSLSTIRMGLPGSCTRCLLRPRRQAQGKASCCELLLTQTDPAAPTKEHHVTDIARLFYADITRLSPRVALYMQASIIASFLAASSAHTSLYALHQARWGFTPITITIVFGTYALAVLAAFLTVGSVSDYVGRLRSYCPRSSSR